MHPRLRRAAAIVAASLLLSSCDSGDAGEAPPEKEAERADALHAADVPDGSSGSLVAVADGEIVTCQGWGETDHESGATAGCEPSTTSGR